MKLKYLAQLTLASKLCYAIPCPREGDCRMMPNGQVQLCGSGYWQMTKLESDNCVGGILAPARTNYGYPAVSPAVGNIRNDKSQVSDQKTSGTGTTGHWNCRNLPAPAKDHGFAMASYRRGGRMASVYRPESNIFRCDIQPPENGFYVAVWTRYDANLKSQPKPRNCNQWLTLKNPRTSRTARALVIDRCASCVGVDHQTSDPDVSDDLVNGATIDLSPELWKELYDGAEDGVYDIEYNGPVYGGSLDGQPDALLSLTCAKIGA